METMQFRDYIFPYNPQSITVTEGTNTVTLFCPGKGEVTQNLGGGGRVVRCAGSFWGGSFEEAVRQVTLFRRSAGERACGMLLIPGMEPFWAHLKELVFEASGDGRIIPYTMLFVEEEATA